MQMTATSLTDIQTIAQDFVAKLKMGDRATVVCLRGELGAGKTTFSQAVANILGVSENVTSPTFVIEKIYELSPASSHGFSHFIHIDAYRLNSSDELAKLGFDRIAIDSKNLIFIEWPERVNNLFTADQTLQLITFSHVNDTTRTLTFEIIHGQDLSKKLNS